MVPVEAPTVAIVGLGYVGLPIALGLHETGAKLIASRSAAGGSTPSVAATSISWPMITPACGSRSTATPPAHLRSPALADADAVIVCVPTPVDAHEVPDLVALRAACASVVANARPGQVIILTSTSYVGCTRDLVATRWSSAGSRWGPTCTWPSRPSGSIPGRATTRRRSSRASSAGVAGVRGARRRGDRPRRPHPHRQLARGRGVHQAARELVPGGEHRVRERDGRRRADGPRVRRGRRGRGHEAVRVHAVPRRHRCRRALHPVRPALPAVAAAPRAHGRPRSCSGDEGIAARPGRDRRPGDRNCSPTGHRDSRRQRAGRGRRLQAGRRGHARVAGLEILERLLARGADVDYVDPRVPELSLPDGSLLRSIDDPATTDTGTCSSSMCCTPRSITPGSPGDPSSTPPVARRDPGPGQRTGHADPHQLTHGGQARRRASRPSVSSRACSSGRASCCSPDHGRPCRRRYRAALGRSREPARSALTVT